VRHQVHGQLGFVLHEIGRLPGELGDLLHQTLHPGAEQHHLSQRPIPLQYLFELGCALR